MWEPGDTESLEGRYANFFRIGHNGVEFVVDFGQFYEGHAAPRLHTRIVTSPVYAKDLWQALGESVARYEDEFGPIRDG